MAGSDELYVPDDHHPAATGAMIGEAWCVERTLGRGGTGSVFRCYNRHAPRIHAAIKLLDPAIQNEPEARDRMMREAEILCTIDHANVVKVSNVHIDARPPYIEMEFVDGLELKDELAQYGQLPPDVALDRVRQLAGALKYLHRRRIYHRDVKPQNILTRQDGTLKLVDFGLAIESRDASRGTFGTVSYCPPEWGQSEVDPASWDLYALGVVLYEMLTGTVAFPVPAHADPQQQLVRVMRDKQAVDAIDPGPGFHPDLRALVRDLTAKNPSERIADARALESRLESIELSGWPPPRAPTPGPPPARSALPSPILVAGLGGGLAVMVVLGLLGGIAAAVVVLLALGVVPMYRDAVVTVTGLPEGIGVAVRIAGQPASEVEGRSHRFLRLPVEDVPIEWAVGERCVPPCGSDCPVWCTSGRTTHAPGVGLGPWELDLALVPPPPREVRVRAAVQSGFARLDGQEVPFVDGVATFPAIEPGAHALFAAAGVCEPGCRGSDCGALCAVTSSSVVVPATGELPDIALELRAPEPVEDSDAPEGEEGPVPDGEEGEEPATP